MNTIGQGSFQVDLGLEVILVLFSKAGLTNLFKKIENEKTEEISSNALRIISLQNEYINSIDAVIQFLQGKNPTLAHLICQEDFLPEASRFQQMESLDWAFGSMGTQDKAKHLATLYLEDLSDLIIECVDSHFGFSRYAERLGRSANSFDELYAAIIQPLSYIDEITIDILKNILFIEKEGQSHSAEIPYKLIGFSVPFPGNLYSAFRCAKFIKEHFKKTKIVMGGGFANTELRSLSDPRVFEFFDFITLDDGEAPLEEIIQHIENENVEPILKRTFVLEKGAVVYLNNSKKRDYPQTKVGTPDYSDLPLDKYVSVIEMVNPMHRMWSDGRWNKLTMAHGCYWGKCTFCDISLDYIKNYEPISAHILVDRMEEMIAQTGQSGFHFVDEAAPPALMRDLALEIIRRGLTLTWWTNIRFEKSFSADLCQLLKASGCIAVSGGLEVASDRLLALIQKGVTVAQVAQVAQNFTQSGIMVHAYLMYGFPTQTAQETIDSLEMVRQMFELGILQSAYWHQFAMTAHAPVGMYPAQFGVQKISQQEGSFANNDLLFIDKQGTDHEAFSFGLKKSLYNFMHGIGFEMPLAKWFEGTAGNVKIPKTKIAPDFIEIAITQNQTLLKNRSNQKLIWLGNLPQIELFSKNKKGQIYPMAKLIFHTKKEEFEIALPSMEGVWLVKMLELVSIKNKENAKFDEIVKLYEASNLDDFELFLFNKPVNILFEKGLVLV